MSKTNLTIWHETACELFDLEQTSHNRIKVNWPELLKDINRNNTYAWPSHVMMMIIITFSLVLTSHKVNNRVMLGKELHRNEKIWLYTTKNSKYISLLNRNTAY